MKTQKHLLQKLLKTLVDELGYEEVSAALVDIGEKDSLEGVASAPIRRSGKKITLSTEQVQSVVVDQEKKDLLLELAARYDRKSFLPSIADVREFLIMIGERPGGMKNRDEAFRTLLRTLMRLPVTRLQQLVQTAAHSGPSELGPISDAISSAGERLPRQRSSTE